VNHFIICDDGDVVNYCAHLAEEFQQPSIAVLDAVIMNCDEGISLPSVL